MCKYFPQHVCRLQSKISVFRMSSKQMKQRSNSSSSGGILSCLRLRLTCDMFVVEFESILILSGFFIWFVCIVSKNKNYKKGGWGVSP